MSTPKIEKISTITISEEEAGERLDKILVARFGEEHSRTYFQHLFEEGLITVNGNKIKKQYRSEPGDQVAIIWTAREGINLTPEAIPLDIIFEDEYILVINKPAGMVVHPAPGHHSGTFVHALLHHCELPDKEINDLRPGIVHRLDKETSGLLIAAKNLHTHQKLITLFSERKVEKEYLAVCVGSPGTRSIDASIGRHPFHRKEMAVRTGGKSAVTHFTTLTTDGKISVVRAQPLTGRTHQIRVHLQHLRTPILGDRIYGSESANKKYGVSRQMLHAYRLRFFHPETGKALEFTALIPDDMQQFIAPHLKALVL